eukprot:5877774-Pleurochrysis_carterae.AAC.1
MSRGRNWARIQSKKRPSNPPSASRASHEMLISSGKEARRQVWARSLEEHPSLCNPGASRSSRPLALAAPLHAA